MRTIDQKMLRDLRNMRGQVIAIVFVIISGVATFVTVRATMDSLQETLDAYYHDYRFADVFATVRRAPESLKHRIQAVPGTNLVETRVVAAVNLEVAGFDEPVAGQLVSIPEGTQPLLNRLHIRKGRLVRPGRENEVILNETFAEAHDFRPGDQLTAVINGRRKQFTVVGIALSPEFLLQVQPGTLFPDPERYGVLWMGREALAAAYDMEGAFNDLVISLAPGASVERVIDRLDILLKPYGSLNAYGRDEQPSNFYITEEFKQLRSTATILPFIFLAVAAFLLNIVITRLISTQREQIAVLKAFGYDNFTVGMHYVKLVLLIAAIGIAGGIALGIWLGRETSEIYLVYYRFPYLEFQLDPGVAVTASALTIGAALLGVIQAVRKAVVLPPAEAMRPAPPATYRPTFVERLGLKRYFDEPTRMIARHLERQPVKSLLTVIGISFSCAILVVGGFFEDSFEYMIGFQFGVAQQEDLMVTFTEPASTAALYELAQPPGVVYAEPIRSVPVRMINEHRSYDTSIEGIPTNPNLRQILDTESQPIHIPPDGLVVADRLADILDIQPGDEVTIEVLEGARRTRRVPVAGVAEQYLGVSSYMNLRSLNQLVGNGAAISGVLLTIDERYENTLIQQLQRRPRVAGILAQERAVQAFWDSSAQSMLTMTFIMTLFAGVIAFGIVYNSARISLSERDRELATLRVIGFTRGEISYILLGELALLTLIALPIGFILGAMMCTGLAEAVQTDLYRFPVILKQDTFAFAAAVVLAASAISALIVRRRLDTLDLVGVLKTRE